jgi:phosphatidate cytidylyltransferase
MPSVNVGSAGYLGQSHKGRILRERIATILFMMPFVMWIIADGEWLYMIAIASILSLAAIEYGYLFRRNGLRPAIPLIGIGVFCLAVTRYLFGFEHMPLILACVCLASEVWHMVDYELGASRSGTDFAITVAGITFLGWIGSYLISLRLLPDGVWWLFIALASVWIADGFAYLGGRAFGRHHLSRRLSPNKTWEGYLIGIICGSLGGTGIALLGRIGAGETSDLNAVRGFILGAVISVLAPLGDLGVSMIKREIQVKDTSSMLPGHGGALDRTDSWLWAGVLGFYLVTWLT